MSLVAVQSRLAELDALLSRPVGAPPAPAATSFASTLSTATTAPVTAAATGGGDSSYDSLIADAAQRNGVDPALLKGLIRQESDFNPNAGSAAGAQGLTQLMPGTAAALGVQGVAVTLDHVEHVGLVVDLLDDGTAVEILEDRIGGAAPWTTSPASAA